VIANDPADTSVYILSGIAVDPAGNTIVLPQPVTYDIGREMDGQLYLLLSYGESRPRADGGETQAGAPLHIYAEYSIAAVTALPDTPWVELARVKRSSREAAFSNAPNPANPDVNQIDLRFRREVGAPPEVHVGVAYLGQAGKKKHGRGAAYLAQTLNRTGSYRVLVEDNIPLGPNIAAKTMVYLVGEGSFELDQGLMNGLRNYVQRGMGTLFMESVDATAETSFMNFLKVAKLAVEPLKPGHRLLAYPNLFATPPLGFESQSNSKIMVGEGVIFDTCNYGLLWQGERHNGLPPREEIRTAMEWGGNILTYASERYRLSGKR
jgi:hypothetical protein